MRILDKTALILTQLESWGRIGYKKHGFRRYHSTQGHIITVLDVLKIGVRGRKPNKLLLFIDFSKAFDTVDHNYLMEILPEYILDANHRSLIGKLLQP
jgi:retron-type reverse transcriptase